MVRSSIFSTIILLAVGFAVNAWGLEEIVRGSASRECKVWNRPADDSLEPNPKLAKRQSIGALSKGQQVVTKAGEKRGFYPIVYKGRIGYILKSCLDSAETRKPDSLLFSGYSNEEFRFGLNTSADANMARAASTADASSSFGYGFGLIAMIPISRMLRISFSPLYRKISATRTFTSSASVLTDPSTASFSQKISFLGLETLLQLNLIRRAGINTPLEFWLDGGAEYLFPLSAEQTDNFGNTVSFKATDRPLLGLIGPSLLYHFEGRFALNASLHGFYNVFATGGSSLMGARFGLSATLAL